jgi:hypothetical protein
MPVYTDGIQGECGCCGGCHCCDHIDSIPGWGYFQQWDITFNSSAPSPFTSSTVRVYKVAGEPMTTAPSKCKWESIAGTLRVFMLAGEQNYNYFLYAAGSDADGAYTYRSIDNEFESVGLFFDGEWCREEGNENAMEDCDDPYIDGYSVTPVTGTWVGCVPP